MTETSIFRDVPAGATLAQNMEIKDEIFPKTYTGYVVKRMPNGHGKMTYPVGDRVHERMVTYEGNFTNGKKNGIFTISEEGKDVVEVRFDMDRQVHENEADRREVERLNKRDEYWTGVNLGARELAYQIPMPRQRSRDVFANARTRTGGTRRRKQTKRGKKSKKTKKSKKNMRKLV